MGLHQLTSRSGWPLRLLSRRARRGSGRVERAGRRVRRSSTQDTFGKPRELRSVALLSIDSFEASVPGGLGERLHRAQGRWTKLKCFFVSRGTLRVKQWNSGTFSFSAWDTKHYSFFLAVTKGGPTLRVLFLLAIPSRASVGAVILRLVNDLAVAQMNYAVGPTSRVRSM